MRLGLLRTLGVIYSYTMLLTGTLASPVRTPQRALGLLRSLPAEPRRYMVLRAGTYFLDDTLSLGAADSVRIDIYRYLKIFIDIYRYVGIYPVLANGLSCTMAVRPYWPRRLHGMFLHQSPTFRLFSGPHHHIVPRPVGARRAGVAIRRHAPQAQLEPRRARIVANGIRWQGDERVGQRRQRLGHRGLQTLAPHRRVTRARSPNGRMSLIVETCVYACVEAWHII